MYVLMLYTKKCAYLLTGAVMPCSLAPKPLPAVQPIFCNSLKPMHNKKNKSQTPMELKKKFV